MTGVTATISSFVAPTAKANVTACWNEEGAASTAIVAATRMSALVFSSITDAAKERAAFEVCEGKLVRLDELLEPLADELHRTLGLTFTLVASGDA